jgi:hypothetical protein
MIPKELDTVVVPTREDGFQEVFLGQSRWYAIRIDYKIQPRIKYIAAYQTAPVSAITHIAPVKSIAPWDDDIGKVVLNFAEPARPLGPLPLMKGGRTQAPQSPRYTTHQRLLKATNLDDAFEPSNT